MRLLSLNIWGGKLYAELSRFLESHIGDVDIFCFQEVFNDGSGTPPAWEGALPDIYGRLCGMLGGFDAYLGEPYTSLGERLAIFVRKGIGVAGTGEIMLCEQRELYNKETPIGVGSNLQWLEFSDGKSKVTVANVHGLWQPKSKDDSEDTVTQSGRIMEFFGERGGEGILCGDLNLGLNTESIRVLEQGLRNLIRECGITSTRNRFAHRLAGDFADYVFVSGGLGVRRFEVPADIVSDHQPMLLDFG